MVTSTKTVIQYGPPSAEITAVDKDFSAEGYMYVKDTDFSLDSEYNIKHLLAAQNPRARRGFQGWRTENTEDWSDSPTYDPARPENERWSYGRGPDAETPGSYGNLDLYSGVLISQRNFSVSSEGMVRSFKTSGYGTIVDRDFSKYGETTIPPLEAESSYVNVYQYPFVLEALPVPFSYKNPVDTNVYLRLSNYTYELDADSVEFYVDGVRQDNSTITVTPFVVGAGGLDLLWTNPDEFDYGQQVEVEWRVNDKADPPNTIIFNYWFMTVEDTVGPRLISTSPLDNATGVSIDSCVSVTVDDYEGSVNISSIEFYVNNLLAPAAGITSVSNDDGSTTFTYCPDNSFLYGDDIAVSFYIEDNSSNYLFHSFNFTTETSDAPRSVENAPSEGETDVSRTAKVSVHVVGDGGGVKINTIILSIDGEQEDTLIIDPVVYREEE